LVSPTTRSQRGSIVQRRPRIIGKFTHVAPSILCIRGNPEETIPFFAAIEKSFRARKAVNLDIADVVDVQPEAVLLLLASAVRFHNAGLTFSGNYPKDKTTKKRFLKSGFFDDLNAGKVAGGGFSKPESLLVTHARFSVEAALTANLMQQAAEVVWTKGASSPSVQRVFLELMHNTNNHASPERNGEKEWWSSVTFDRDKHRAKFVFADFGIGVIKSLNRKSEGHKWYDIRSHSFKVYNDANPALYLKLILDRTVHQTVTGKPFRGKGLPGIKDLLDRNGIQNLWIVTNNVLADVSSGRYTSLGCSFEGTIVCWEIDRSNTCTYPS
jgi:hypothetical protein